MENNITSENERLLAAIAYVASPVSPLIIFLIPGKKDLPYVKQNLAQALVVGITLYVLSALLSFVLIGCVIAVLGILYELYLAAKAYKGESIVIPVVTNFVKKQGWA